MEESLIITYFQSPCCEQVHCLIPLDELQGRNTLEFPKQGNPAFSLAGLLVCGFDQKNKCVCSYSPVDQRLPLRWQLPCICTARSSRRFGSFWQGSLVVVHPFLTEFPEKEGGKMAFCPAFAGLGPPLPCSL